MNPSRNNTTIVTRPATTTVRCRPAPPGTWRRGGGAPAGTTEIRLLGPLEVRRAGHPVAGFESRKAVGLLAYLASRPLPVARAQLVELLWPGLSEERGRANLSGALHSLASLMPGCFAADRQAIAYQPLPSTWLDTDEFWSRASDDDPLELAGAVSLYREEFLAGLYLDDCAEFELWLVRMRERWRARVVEVLAALVEHCLAADRFVEGLRFAWWLLDLEPWHENVHRLVIVLLARSGQRGAALAQYRTCCRTLEAEFGVAPSAQTVALYQRLCEPGEWGPPISPKATTGVQAHDQLLALSPNA